ncbi:MAG: hypothetical protein RLZZ519_3195 [Bacteroidota bacterium]|jgi:hypothetical protein
MNSFDKDAYPQDSPRILAACLVGTSIFLERFIYDACRTILIMYVVQELGIEEFRDSFRHSPVLVLILSALSGILVDFLVSTRSILVQGALLNAIGLGCIATGFDVAVIAGVALTLVGSSAAKMGNMTHFGFMLSSRSNHIEGGFSIVWVILNVGAFFGGLLMGLLVISGSFTYQTGFWLLTGLASVHAIFLLIISVTGILPAARPASSGQGRRVLSSLLGTFLMIVLAFAIFVFHFWMMQPSFYFMSESLVYAVLLMTVVLGFILFAVSPSPSALRRNSVMLLILLLTCVLGATIRLSGDLARQYVGYFNSMLSVQIQSMLVLLLNLGIGLAFVLRKSTATKGFSGAGMRLLIGVGLSTLGVCIYLVFPYVGTIAMIAAVLLGAVGEALYDYLTFATVWRMTPANRKGTAMGLLMASGGLGYWIADQFTLYNMDIGGKPDCGIWVPGMVMLAALSMMLVVAIWVMLRNQQEDAPIS